ncbi:protein PAL OF QUIRKY [Malania oleifera]|uniref:protein PAL OF QUIRKY n=1 Tax=Malania oleifera TaxID=397392 RepID=UPI0025AE1314|nr:protein PAL OF QUIRKY [Malania oleifera]XP_057960604.1 protein PAL OF QUIRKY [Malania oleifera]
MSSHHPSEFDTATTDSVASSPRSDHPPRHRSHDDPPPRLRFMCSFGGKILPRPHDNQLRYVGGDTRIVAFNRHTTFSALLLKLSKLAGTPNITVKYQLPSEDLDALISVTTDEDVENMMEEYDRSALAGLGSKTARLRLFLFPAGDDSGTARATSIGSLLDGSSRRDWFLDALNGGGAAGLERGRSEASSIVSEVPDYLFGLDNPDEPKTKARPFSHDSVSVSDPGSPLPPVSSPFCSTSSAPCVQSVPDLPPVKTKLDNPIPVAETKEIQFQPENFAETGEQVASQSTGYAGNPMWPYAPNVHFSGPAVQQLPVYYVQGPGPPANLPGQPIPIRATYVHQFPTANGQVRVGYPHPGSGFGQVFGGGMRPMVPQMDPYEMGGGRVVHEGVNQQQQQQVYFGRNAGMVPGYPGLMVPPGEELQRTASDPIVGRVSRSP